jgi:hypothetical protein
VKDPNRVRKLLCKTATPKEPKTKYGAGILNVDKATASARRSGWWSVAKRILIILLGLIFPFAVPGRPGFKLLLAGAFMFGAFGPELLASNVGMDSPWNLIGFSALLPLLLFFELEKGRASQLVGGLAFGVACCLGWALMTTTLGDEGLPWSEAAFGNSALPFTILNLGLATVLGGIAWLRGAVADDQ